MKYNFYCLVFFFYYHRNQGCRESGGGGGVTPPNLEKFCFFALQFSENCLHSKLLTSEKVMSPPPKILKIFVILVKIAHPGRQTCPLVHQIGLKKIVPYFLCSLLHLYSFLTSKLVMSKNGQFFQKNLIKLNAV